MKNFECEQCNQLLFFENITCEGCGSALGYLSDRGVLSTLVFDGGVWQALANPEPRYRYCVNYNNATCNWLVLTTDTHPMCIACQLNRTIPNIDNANHWQCWQRLEEAKHRLVYSLLRFELPITSKQEEPWNGLAFDFLADEPTFQENSKVMTGHKEGLITINIAEADPVERERFRIIMTEPYRTLLGHFRHEVGHYYWELLVRPYEDRLNAFRRHFGDENSDYAQALQTYYDQGPSVNWAQHYVSGYATAHPWEDWAETWTHYLHIVDTLETAYAFGLRVKPQVGNNDKLASVMMFDPYQQTEFDLLIKTWLPLVFALNSLNRSMGHSDAYPFVLTASVLEKIRFVHQLIHAQTPVFNK